MTSRRRRSRITLTSVLVVLALAVGGYALEASGALGPDADAAGTTEGERPRRAVPRPGRRPPSDRSRRRRGRPPPPVRPSAAEPTPTRSAHARSSPTCPSRARQPAPATTAPATSVAPGSTSTATGATPGTTSSPATSPTSPARAAAKCSPAPSSRRTAVRRWTSCAVTRPRPSCRSTTSSRSRTPGAPYQQLTEAERQALANDPANLFAVDEQSNSQKGSGDAATWLPANKAFRCTYVEHQVTVKAKYRLWVAPAERDAMVRVLDAC